MKIKVCGITDIQQAKKLEKKGVDFIGFIGYAKSPRYAWNRLDFPEVAALKNIQKVGVFVNESVSKIKETVDEAQLNFVQLHGNESIEDVKEIAEFIPIIKAIAVGNESTNIQKKIDEYAPFVEYFLFDTATHNYGGSGRQFQWDILNELKIHKPYFLSGGIDLNTNFKNNQFKKEPFALDINSRFEIEPGLKDINKIELFMTKIN